MAQNLRPVRPVTVQVMPQGNTINHTSFVLAKTRSGGNSQEAIVSRKLMAASLISYCMLSLAIPNFTVLVYVLSGVISLDLFRLLCQ